MKYCLHDIQGLIMITLGSDVRVILKVTLAAAALILYNLL